MTNAGTIPGGRVDAAVRRENLKRVHKDRMRPLRVLEYLDNSAIFENSPVEVREGYVISDRDNGDLFLVLSFRSLSEEPLTALKIRVLLFRDHKPIPYERHEYEYSWHLGTFGIRALNGVERKEKEIRDEISLRYGETFGDGIYLPVPSTYFSKLQVDLLEVSYANGTTQKLGLTAGAKAKHFYELPDGLRDVYSDVNIFQAVESLHPIRVLPEQGEKVWLCCCGHKNPLRTEHCEVCGRDRAWQMEHLTVEQLEEKEREVESKGERRILHDLTKYKPKSLESAEEIAKKVELCNQVMEKLAIQEREKDQKPVKIFKRILIILAIGALLYVGFRIGYNILREYGYFSDTGSGTQTAEAAGETAETNLARDFRMI